MMRQATWIIVATLLGASLGMGVYTFIYGQGYSYLTKDPAACANCHIMQPHFDAWIKSSHRRAAACNDCHTPRNLVGKYIVKAMNGVHHSWAFTTGLFHEPLEIKSHNLWVTESTCRGCHGQIFADGSVPEHSLGEASCIRCHANVGHNQ